MPIPYAAPQHRPAASRSVKRVRDRQVDRARGSARQRGYDRRWDAFAKAYKDRHPLCRLCRAQGKLEPTFAVDHIIPLRERGAKFDEANLQPLCETCHNSRKQSEERLGYSREIDPATGWPRDPRHPANQSRR